jgi:hypothetical protein
MNQVDLVSGECPSAISGDDVIDSQNMCTNPPVSTTRIPSPTRTVKRTRSQKKPAQKHRLRPNACGKESGDASDFRRDVFLAAGKKQTAKNPKILSTTDWEISEDFANWCGGVDLNEIINQQIRDPEIGWVRQAILDCPEKPTRQEVSPLSRATRAYVQQWDDLVICKNILFRKKHHDTPGEFHWQLVVPAEFRKTIFEYLHCGKTAGHMGINKTWKKIRNRFYWVGHKQDIMRWCQQCRPCLLQKHDKRRKKAPLTQDPSGAPMQRVAIDYMGPISTTSSGNTVILVVVDYFTKWGEAYALPDMTATRTADCLVENFFSKFGIPATLHSDQGTNFQSKLFQEVMELLGIQKTRTTYYRPQSDGLVENLNQTLKGIIQRMIIDQPKDWDEHLQLATMAYRATPHSSTGYSPNQMMLGREVLLPIDLLVGPAPGESDTFLCSTEYVQWLQNTFRKAHARARENNAQALRSQRRYYDEGKGFIEVPLGTWVYWKVRGKKDKFSPNYQGPWCVTEKLNDVLYRLAPSAEGPSKVINVDDLKTCTGDHPPNFVEDQYKSRHTQTELVHMTPEENSSIPSVKPEPTSRPERVKNPQTRQLKKGKTENKPEKVIYHQPEPELRTRYGRLIRKPQELYVHYTWTPYSTTSWTEVHGRRGLS